MKKSQLKQLISEIIQEVSNEPYYVVYLVNRGGTWKLLRANKVDTEEIAKDMINQYASEEVAGDWSSYEEKSLHGELIGVTEYNWDADFGKVKMFSTPVSLVGELVGDKTTNMPDVTAGDLDHLSSLNKSKTTKKNIQENDTYQWKDGFSISVDYSGKPAEDGWENLGYANGWSPSEREKIFSDLKGESPRTIRMGSNKEVVYYPKAKMWYTVDSSG